MIDKFDGHKYAFIIDGMELKFHPKLVESLIGFREGEVELDS